MHLLVGLGNPGSKYTETPHNAGFWVADEFSKRHRLGAESKRFKGLFRRGRIEGRDIGVLKPQTYMNRSGESVGEALRYLPVRIEELTVIFDDMDLPLGKLRIRPSGGHGGHNGMRSLIEHLGSREFARIRVGVGRPAGGRSATSHLLSKVSPEHRKRLGVATERAVDAVDSILEQGIESAMNRFNGLPALDAEEETT